MLNNAKKHFSDVEKERAVQYFSKLPRRLEYVRNMAQKGIADYRKLEKSANAKKLDGNNIKKIIKRIEKVNKFIEEDPLAYMMTESLRGVEYTLRAGMYQDKQDEREEIRESAKMGYFFLKTMVRAVDEMMPLYKELAEYKGD